MPLLVSVNGAAGGALDGMPVMIRIDRACPQSALEMLALRLLPFIRDAQELDCLEPTLLLSVKVQVHQCPE